MLTNSIGGYQMSEARGLRDSGLFQVQVPVRDIERAIVFYRDALALPLHARRGDLAFFSAGHMRLLVEQISETGGRYGHAGSILYFKVEDIQASYLALQERGVNFIDPPTRTGTNERAETWMAFFEDGDWNTHAIVSQVAVG
jgi:catechol 2,3-dioxygenase-like lactoylglutathione lyase family enzyme